MLGYTGRYAVEFRHAGEDYGRHQMLNSNDRAVAQNAFTVSAAQVAQIGPTCDVTGIRLVDTESAEVLTEWIGA